jgi:hypothetical protein
LLLVVLAFLPGSPGQPARADGLSVFRESPDEAATINPGDFRRLGDALQGKVKVVDLVNFGRLRFLSWPARRRLTFASLDRFSDFSPVRPPAALEGYGPPVVERVAPLRVQFALQVKSLNKLLESLGSPTFLPARLEGRTFTLSTAPELRFRYPSRDLQRRGDLLFSATRDPVLEVPPGVDLDQVRTALLALPLWPEPLRRKMAAVPLGSGSGGAAIVLDPVGGEEAEEVRINGHPGVFLHLPRGPEARLSPEVLALRRQAIRQAVESGDPWAESHLYVNTLLWHHNGLLLSLSGEGLTLAEAKAVAEAVR